MFSFSDYIYIWTLIVELIYIVKDSYTILQTIFRWKASNVRALIHFEYLIINSLVRPDIVFFYKANKFLFRLLPLNGKIRWIYRSKKVIFLIFFNSGILMDTYIGLALGPYFNDFT